MLGLLPGVDGEDATPPVEQLHLAASEKAQGALAFEADGRLLDEPRRGLACQEARLDESVRAAPLALLPGHELTAFAVGNRRSDGLVRALDLVCSPILVLPWCRRDIRCSE